MKNKIALFPWLFTMLSLLLLVGCKGKQKKDEPKKVAIVVSTLNNPWFVFLAETAAAASKKHGYDARIFDSQNNTAIESEHFENAIVSGFDAILFNPTDADGSISNVQKAKEAGLPVFCMDREINANGVATSQILSDSYAGCVALGKLFVEKLNRKGRYVELLGLVGDNNTWARSKGFHSVVDYYKDLTMVAQQSADFDRNKALEVMESILTANPDIDAVFCGNDAMALGAYQALVSAGKAAKVKVFGFDGADDMINAIQEGKATATGMQFPAVIAETAADYAHQFFNGRKVFPEKMPVSVELVSAQNVNYYLAFGKK